MRNDHVIQSSFDQFSGENIISSIEPSRNGFVNSAIAAYFNHQHLVLRPDDIWLAILTQFSLYINKNAENLRHKFVAHTGQVQLEVRSNLLLDTVDFGQLASHMGLQIDRHTIDPELRSWIMPNFSTTTSHDIIVASIVFMGSMKKYFTYLIMLKCGLPSVTLLGNRSDWQQLYDRLEKLQSLGPEAKTWHSLLVPLFRRFVETFDAPHSEPVKRFWQQIAHRQGGSGVASYCGWITAFCFWGGDGVSIYGQSTSHGSLELDGMQYFAIKSDEIPPGYAVAPVIVDNNGEIFETFMAAGSVGWWVTNSGIGRVWGTGERDMLQPTSGWWIFERTTEKTIQEDGRLKREEDERLKREAEAAGRKRTERRRLERLEMLAKWDQLGEKRLGRSS